MSKDFQEYHLPEHYIIDIEEKKPQITKNLSEQQFMPQYMGMMNLITHQNEDVLRHAKSQVDVKQEDRQMIRNDSNASLKDDVLGLQNIKGNVKNAYIKKINSLLSVNAEEEKEKLLKVSESQQRLRFQRDQHSSSSHRQIDNDEIKMQKNRESARNSRQRKKLYIGLLEKKVEDLNGQIEGLRQHCEITFKNIHQIIDQNPCLKGMIIEQAQIFDQLGVNKEGDNNDNQELQALLTDSYKLKFSATGSRRKLYLKYCFQNIVKSLLEGNYGPLLFGTNFIHKNFHPLEEEELNDYVKNFKDVTGITEDKSQQAVPVIQKIIEHKRNFSFLIKSMKQKQKNLRICQQQLEDQIEEATNQMTSAQFTNLLLSINKAEDGQMKEEFNSFNQYKSREQYQNNQSNILSQYNFMPQLPLELLLNSKPPILLPNNLLIDPLQINDFIQKKFCK